MIPSILTMTLRILPILIVIRMVLSLLGHLIEPKWRFRIWLVIIPAVLVPTLPAAPFSLYQVYGGWEKAAVQSILWEPSNMSPAVPSLEGASQTTSYGTGSAHSITAFHGVTSKADAPKIPWASGFYLLGIGVVFLVSLAEGRAFTHTLRVNRKSCPQGYQELLEACKKDFAITIPVSVALVKGLSSPCLTGLIKPTILIPEKTAGTLSERELSLIFKHELAHLKRKDLLWEWLFLLLRAIHWFNPLIWLWVQWIREEMELACDAAVLKQLPPAGRIEYGRTLLMLAEATKKPPLLATACGLTNGYSTLKKRILLASKYPKPLWRNTVAGVLLFIVLGCIAISQPPEPTAVAQKTLTEETAKQTVAQWLTPGTSVRSISVGDLNRDSKDDIVAVLERASFFQPLSHRELFILLTQPDGSYQVSVRTTKALMLPTEGGIPGDPLDKVSINRGSVLIAHSGGDSRRWSSTYRIRYQKDNWYLIGATLSSYNVQSPINLVKDDYNLLTGDHIRESTNSRKAYSATRDNRGVRPLVPLEAFDPHTVPTVF